MGSSFVDELSRNPLGLKHFIEFKYLRGYLLFGASQIFRAVRLFLTKQFWEWFAMSDERRAHEPTPYLQTRPATLLTAIGHCAAIIAMQLVSEMRDFGSGRAAAPVVAGIR